MQTRTLQELLAYISVHDGYFCERDLGPDGFVSVNTHGFTGDTPLHLMAWSNDAEGTQMLLTAGADPNAAGEMGETPLHTAIRQNSLDTIRVLLAAGASTSIRSEFGQTPEELATTTGGAVADVLRSGA